GNTICGFQARGLGFLADDIHAQLDAFVADEHGRASDQLAHLVLALSAERAVEGVLAVARIACHALRSLGLTSSRPHEITGAPRPSQRLIALRRIRSLRLGIRL